MNGRLLPQPVPQCYSDLTVAPNQPIVISVGTSALESPPESAYAVDLTFKEFDERVMAFRALAEGEIPTGTDAAAFVASVPGDRELIARLFKICEPISKLVDARLASEASVFWAAVESHRAAGLPDDDFDWDGGYPLRDSLDCASSGWSKRRGDHFSGFHGEIVEREFSAALQPFLSFPSDQSIPMIFRVNRGEDSSTSSHELDFEGAWFIELGATFNAIRSLALACFQMNARSEGLRWLTHLSAITYRLVPVRLIEYCFVRNQRQKLRDLINSLAMNGVLKASEVGALRATARSFPLDERLAASGELLYFLEGLRIAGSTKNLYQSTVDEKFAHPTGLRFQLSLRDSIDTVQGVADYLKGMSSVLSA